MTFALFSAASGFLVVGLYLRRNRPRKLIVPFSPLFEGGKKEGRLARLAPRLLHPLSLLLQLALVVLFLYLGRPPVEVPADSKAHVVLLDVSEEMGRTDEKGKAARELSALRIGEFVRSLPEGEAAHVLALSGAPHVLWSGSGGARDVARKLDARIEFGEPNLGEALALARELGGKDVFTYLVSPRRSDALSRLDGETTKGLKLLETAFPPVDPKKELSLRAFGARRYPSDPKRFEALLRIDHGSGAPRPIEVVFSVVDEKGRRTPFFSERRTLGGDASEELRFPNLEERRGALVATIRAVDGSFDGLASDEVGFATIEERALLTVGVSGPKSTFLEAALALDPFLRTARPEEVPSVALVTSGEKFPEALERPTLLFGAPPKDGKLVRSAKKLENFGLDNWQEHPLFTDVDPYDIQILLGTSLSLGPGDRSLADSSGAAVVVQGMRGGFPFLAVGFRPEESDFVLRAAYPIFIHNALRFLADQKTALPRGVEVNRPAKIRLEGAADGEARIEGPLGDAPEIWSGRVSAGVFEMVAARPGLYAISAPGKERIVAVRRPPSVATTGVPKTALESAPETRALASKSSLLVVGTLLLFAFVLFEWWGYHRRVIA